MAFIKEYWDEKEKRAMRAERHTTLVAEKYKDQIAFSVENTKMYKGECNPESSITRTHMEIKITPEDTVTAIQTIREEYPGTTKKVAALNFSSYKNPGGMFLNGSKAQEECLCHDSFLYNVLKEQDLFYKWNRMHLNAALYLNMGLYSPSIYFLKGSNVYIADVITCAAPNKSAAQKYKLVSDEDNTDALKSRIKFVLNIALDQGTDVLVLGAYGCGVFGQNPYEVAEIFHDYLTSGEPKFEKIVFAIPEGKNKNYEAFKTVFNKEDLS